MEPDKARCEIAGFCSIPTAGHTEGTERKIFLFPYGVTIMRTLCFPEELVIYGCAERTRYRHSGGGAGFLIMLVWLGIKSSVLIRF